MKKKTSKLCHPTPDIRTQRVFSEELKRKIVADIATKVHSVAEIRRLYGVSRSAIYKWIYKYSPGLVRGTKQVVQMESEAERTRLAELHAANMERALGRKQMELEIAEKLIETASDSLGIDLKKTFGTQLSSGSGSTEKPMGSR